MRPAVRTHDPDAVEAPRRPRDLFLTESRLHMAYEALEASDPDCEMSADEMHGFLAQYVSVDGAKGARDEFGDYLMTMTALADAKEAAARGLLVQVSTIRSTLEALRERTIKTMRALGVSDILGHYRRLRLKDSRGSVEVVDEGAIPKDYWRTKEDDDLVAVRQLARIVGTLADDTNRRITTREEYVAIAVALVREAEARRRSVDKTAIQQAWKNGQTVDGVTKKITTTLEVA